MVAIELNITAPVFVIDVPILKSSSHFVLRLLGKFVESVDLCKVQRNKSMLTRPEISR